MSGYPTRARPSSTDRGYGTAHAAARKRLEPLVAAGEVRCWRCALPIPPGQPWDLGHDDHDRGVYRGPEHRHSRDCPMGGNRATAGRRWKPPPAPELEPERPGLPASDERWQVPWLQGFLAVPD